MKPWEKFEEDVHVIIKGYLCRIRKNDYDCLCGYVMIPKENKAYKELEQYPENIECHGGITYDEFEILGDTEYRVIGFDCMHLWDYIPVYDIDCPKINKRKVWRDKEYIENELRKITEQLTEIDPHHTNINRLMDMN